MENKLLVTKTEVGTSLFWALFFVIFLWGFWSKEVYALGINFSLFLWVMVLFFVSRLIKKSKYSTSDLAWIIPLFLMALSFALYENPFLKSFNLLIFPVALVFFYIYSWIENKKETNWNLFFLTKTIGRLFNFFTFLLKLSHFLASSIFNKNESYQKMFIKKVLIGLAILLILLLIIVPILSSADPLFAQKLKPFYDFVTNILGTAIIAKLVVFMVLATFALTSIAAWGQPLTVDEFREEKKWDLIVTSIVLGGIFIIYLLFLWVQFDRLWVGALPFDFKETENLVKSGFWQLLFLSFINLAIFFFLYRKTAPIGQKLLAVFSVASILLLASSAYRMDLYVTHYGFSYEKFYAFYAVLFCVILFIWLISQLFIDKKSNIIKFLSFQFLWMFALISIFPVELFILKSNIILAEKPDSRINLFEMTMLSPDVLNQVKNYKKAGKLNDWDSWITKQEKIIREKKWYESTLSTINVD